MKCEKKQKQRSQTNRREQNKIEISDIFNITKGLFRWLVVGA